MQLADSIHETLTPAEKERDMRSGANWFYFIAALAVLNWLSVAFGGTINSPVGLGTTQVADRMLATTGGTGTEIPWAGLAITLVIAAIFAGLGYLSRRGSDITFIVGMFLYVLDAMISLALREFFGFSFHLLALFFMFKGLLASRKRYDPSV